MFKYLLFLLIGIILFILLNNKDNFSVGNQFNISNDVLVNIFDDIAKRKDICLQNRLNQCALIADRGGGSCQINSMVGLFKAINIPFEDNDIDFIQVVGFPGDDNSVPPGLKIPILDTLYTCLYNRESMIPVLTADRLDPTYVSGGMITHESTNKFLDLSHNKLVRLDIAFGIVDELRFIRPDWIPGMSTRFGHEILIYKTDVTNFDRIFGYTGTNLMNLSLHISDYVGPLAHERHLELGNIGMRKLLIRLTSTGTNISDLARLSENDLIELNLQDDFNEGVKISNKLLEVRNRITDETGNVLIIIDYCKKYFELITEKDYPETQPIVADSSEEDITDYNNKWELKIFWYWIKKLYQRIEFEGSQRDDGRSEELNVEQPFENMDHILLERVNNYLINYGGLVRFATIKSLPGGTSPEITECDKDQILGNKYYPCRANEPKCNEDDPNMLMCMDNFGDGSKRCIPTYGGSTQPCRVEEPKCNDKLYCFTNQYTLEQEFYPNHEICYLAGGKNQRCRTVDPQCDGDDLECHIPLGAESKVPKCIREIGGEGQQCRLDPDNKCDDGLECNDKNMIIGGERARRNICERAGGLDEPCRREPINGLVCNQRLRCNANNTCIEEKWYHKMCASRPT